MSTDEIVSDETFLKDRIIFMDGDFNEKLCNKVLRGILYLATHEPEKPVTLFIGSAGGSVFEFFKIWDALKGAPFKLNTVAIGEAQSAGAVLLLAGDKRMAFPNTTIMLHELAYSTGYDKMHDHETVYKNRKKLQEKISEIIKGKTHIKDVKEFLKNDRELSAKEALDLGIIDEIKERI